MINSLAPWITMIDKILTQRHPEYWVWCLYVPTHLSKPCSQPSRIVIQWEEREEPKPHLHISKPWQKLQSYIQKSMITQWWKLYKVIQWPYEFVKQNMIIFELFTFQQNAAVFLDLIKDPSLQLLSVYIYTFISVKAASLPNCPST